MLMSPVVQLIPSATGAVGTMTRRVPEDRDKRRGGAPDFRPGVNAGIGRVRHSWPMGAKPEPGCGARQFQEALRDVRIAGLNRTYAPTTATEKFTLDDYRAGAQNMREVGEIAKHFRMTAIVEFVRASSFVSTLTTLLKMTREADEIFAPIAADDIGEVYRAGDPRMADDVAVEISAGRGSDCFSREVRAVRAVAR